MKTSHPAIHHPQTPQMKKVMESQHVRDNGGQETRAVTLMVELAQDLLWNGPLIGTEEDSLGKMLDVEWHGVLVQVSEKMGVAVRVLNYKMLVEKDWIKHRHEFDGHQVLVVSQSSVAVVYSAVTAQPLQERHVFFQTIASQVQLITGIVSLLSGK